MTAENILTMLLALVCLGSAAANYLHWHRRAGERFFYFPTAGVLQAVNKAWVAAQIISAVLSFTPLLSSLVFFAICISWNTAAQIYSMWYRQMLRRQADGSRAA